MKEDAWIEEPAVKPVPSFCLTYSLNPGSGRVRLGSKRIHGLWLTHEEVTAPGFRQGFMRAGNENVAR